MMLVRPHLVMSEFFFEQRKQVISSSNLKGIPMFQKKAQAFGVVWFCLLLVFVFKQNVFFL